MKDVSRMLKDKAVEAFLLAIEIYNKPTIKYRVEGFAVFAVNAWELMLKAYLVQRDGEQAIYFSDNPSRTLSLEGCIRKVFTNEKDPLRLNLEKIIELRNTSTHFITEEYEAVYTPLFQANVVNFSVKINELLGIDIAEHIPENFLSLTVSFRAIEETQIRGKYSDAVSTRLLENAQKIFRLCQENGSRFAITVNHEHYITKKRDEATNIVHICRDGEDPVVVLNKVTDPTKTHPFTTKALMKRLCDKLHQTGVVLLFRGNVVEVNKFHLNNLLAYYGLKSNAEYCFVNDIYKNKQYSYSQKAIDFLFEVLRNNPKSILEAIVPKTKKKGR